MLCLSLRAADTVFLPPSVTNLTWQAANGRTLALQWDGVTFIPQFDGKFGVALTPETNDSQIPLSKFKPMSIALPPRPHFRDYVTNSWLVYPFYVTNVIENWQPIGIEYPSCTVTNCKALHFPVQHEVLKGYVTNFCVVTQVEGMTQTNCIRQIPMTTHGSLATRSVFLHPEKVIPLPTRPDRSPFPPMPQ